MVWVSKQQEFEKSEFHFNHHHQSLLSAWRMGPLILLLQATLFPLSFHFNTSTIFTQALYWTCQSGLHMQCHKKLQMQKPGCNQYWVESSTDPVDNKKSVLSITLWQTNTKKRSGHSDCFLCRSKRLYETAKFDCLITHTKVVFDRMNLLIYRLKLKHGHCTWTSKGILLHKNFHYRNLKLTLCSTMHSSAKPPSAASPNTLSPWKYKPTNVNPMLLVCHIEAMW